MNNLGLDLYRYLNLKTASLLRCSRQELQITFSFSQNFLEVERRNPRLAPFSLETPLVALATTSF